MKKDNFYFTYPICGEKIIFNLPKNLKFKYFRKEIESKLKIYLRTYIYNYAKRVMNENYMGFRVIKEYNAIPYISHDIDIDKYYYKNLLFIDKHDYPIYRGRRNRRARKNINIQKACDEASAGEITPIDEYEDERFKAFYLKLKKANILYVIEKFSEIIEEYISESINRNAINLCYLCYIFEQNNISLSDLISDNFSNNFAIKHNRIYYNCKIIFKDDNLDYLSSNIKPEFPSCCNFFHSLNYSSDKIVKINDNCFDFDEAMFLYKLYLSDSKDYI